MFLNLLWLSIILGIALFDLREHEGVAPAHRAAPSQLLQFTSGGHILAFGSAGVYVAGGSHALHVEFVNPRAINPVSDAVSHDFTPAKAQHARPLSRVTYPNL